MTYPELVFESYNRAIEKSYDRAFNEIGGKDPMKLSESDVAKYLDEEIGKWEKTPMESLKGLTPKEYFNELSCIDDVVEHIRIGARECDFGIPEILVDKLISYGSSAVDKLYNLASDRDMMESEESICISRAAVSILGRRKVSDASDFLVELIKTLDEDKEALVEEITDALISIGEPCTDKLIEELDRTDNIDYVHEYLLTALVKIGRSNRNDRIYRCIKSTFLKMEDKVLGAICVGDYGDGRAIPLLKGYAEKNIGRLDRQTYLEIKAAVKRLGGIVDDMNVIF